jgi:tetratricopeptide (TPR) repeat protein
MGTRVDKPGQAGTVGAEIRALIDQGNGNAAISLADALQGEEVMIRHLRAFAYTEAGAALGEAALLATGAQLWRALDGETRDWMYNLGNAELALFELAVRETGGGDAFTSHRRHLHESRACFQRVGAETSLPPEIRLQALTNLGNSYSQMGRDLEAIASWQSAFEIDPDFAMAHANVAVARERIAPFMGPHVGAVVHEAAAELDRALQRRDDLLRFGGPSALQRFEALRARLPTDPKPHIHEVARWNEPHLQWCREHELFLHVSHPCLRENTPILDPLFFRSLSGGLDGRDDSWADRLFDAYNTLKQGYVSARYVTWLGTNAATELGEDLDTVRNRVAFYDTHLGSRFGLRTGIAFQGFTAAANVLDQVAVFVHLYFKTDRPPRKISFRRLWGEKTILDPTLASWLSRERFNLGLYALIDLASDLEQDSLLDRLLERRHTLTHRFLVAHDFLAEPSHAEPQSDERLERLEWHAILAEAIGALKIARAALIYTARAVDAAEGVMRTVRAGRFVDVPVLQVDPSLNELD